MPTGLPAAPRAGATWRPALSLGVIGAFILAGCGGGGSNGGAAENVAAAAPSPAASAIGAPAPAPAPAGSPAPSASPSPSSAACAVLGAAPTVSNELSVASATYLGLGAGDAARAVAIGADCAVLVAGRFSATTFGVTPTAIDTAASSGAVVKLSADGRSVQAMARLGADVSQMARRPGQGDLALAADTGVAVVGADLRSVRWQQSGSGAASRVAIAADGTVAALFGKTLRVFDASGRELFNRSFGDAAVNDVAIDSATRRIAVTGFAQRDNGGCTKLQVAWVRAYDFANAAAWTAWDWTHAQAAAGSNCADTRGMRVSIGADNKLYFAGESAGGNTIYRWQTNDLAVAAPNVKSDAYTDAYNTASNHITYFARLDLATGKVEKGQLLLSRLDSTKGNTIRPSAITADEAGNVFVAGVSAYAIANRKAIKINGRTLADYAGGDPWVLAVSSDFATRKLWVTPADGGKGETLGVAAANGRVAMAVRADAAPLALVSPLQSTTSGAAGGTAGYAMVWPGF